MILACMWDRNDTKDKMFSSWGHQEEVNFLEVLLELGSKG